MERLKTIKDQLIAQVQSQMGDLKCVDTEELGEVIDMIYDLSKSIYYCTVVKAMEEGKEDEQRKHAREILTTVVRLEVCHKKINKNSKAFNPAC